MLAFLLAGYGISLGGQANTQVNVAPVSSVLATSAIAPPAEYVGGRECVTCHQEQYDAWRGSHHDLAMLPADEDSVLGDFDNASFEYFGTTSRFYRKDGRYFVHTDGPEGTLADYPIDYTFGFYPLQQYLIAFPGGRYQALNIAWDSRSKALGGQRWFHLYPDEHIQAGDELHWTGLNHNWNYMCADCHSTNLRKNYDISSKVYRTEWSDIDVNCEACHGPGSQHLAWAKEQAQPVKDMGLTVVYHERRGVIWPIDLDTGNARRSEPKRSAVEIESCARCHSRRITQKEGAVPAAPLLENHQLELLTDPLYHADGQIDGEVYVYGSFLQSRMYHAGVTCSDCHQPHNLQLRAEGNALCGQCHLLNTYDVQAHHLHPGNSQVPQCVDCHMPAKNFMVIDARRDHSFRIPRPDLSERLQTPNACNLCHSDKSPQWAAGVLERRFGKPEGRHYGEALHAGRYGLPGADRMLSELVLDNGQPAIARATAASLLTAYASRQTAPALLAAANDADPLLGFGLARGLQNLDPARRLPFAFPLLYDGIRTTRALAARSLVNIALSGTTEDANERFEQGLSEYVEAERYNADRPESLVNLARLAADRDDRAEAERLYREALAMAPYYTPGYINLADLVRRTGNEPEVEGILREALPQVRDQRPVHHALGLSLVRQGREDAALEQLRLAVGGAGTNARYLYVYAIALHSFDHPNEAIDVLEKAAEIHPMDRDILYALISMHKELGNEQRAAEYEKRLP